MFSFDETKTSAPVYLRRPFMINGLTLDAKSCMDINLRHEKLMTENTKTLGQDINDNLNDWFLNFNMISQDSPVQDETSGIQG